MSAIDWTKSYWIERSINATLCPDCSVLEQDSCAHA